MTNTTGTQTDGAASTDTQGAQNKQEQSTGGDGFTPVTIGSQEEMDRLFQSRLARERQTITRDYGDLDELKAAADELKAIKDGEKSDLEKEREARAKFEKDATDAQYELMRERVANAKKVPAASISGKTKEELEASADALLEWQRSAIPDKPQQRRNKDITGDLKSGATGAGASGADKKAQAAEALRKLRQG